MLRVAGGVQVEPLTAALHVEAERAVKALGGVELGHGEHEAVERVHAEHAARGGSLRLQRCRPSSDSWAEGYRERV